MELKLTPEIINKIPIRIDNFIYLWLKSIGEEPNFDKSLELMMDGYIFPGGTITKKGNDLVASIVEINNHETYEQLHKELQDRLLKLTGKKQVKANGGYTFLCNSIDLKNKLSKVIVKYKLSDWSKIKKLLLLHIDKAHKQRFDKVMLMQYYIEKNSSSTLASDYESFTDGGEVIKPTNFEL